MGVKKPPDNSSLGLFNFFSQLSRYQGTENCLSCCAFSKILTLGICGYTNGSCFILLNALEYFVYSRGSLEKSLWLLDRKWIRGNKSEIGELLL
jgi:hypothetical protein